jgi:RNA polymerase sigma-70 factor, ECF subfamily
MAPHTNLSGKASPSASRQLVVPENRSIRTGKVRGGTVVRLKGSSVKGLNESSLLEIGSRATLGSLMSVEPDVHPPEPCENRCDSGKLDPAQEVIRLFDETQAPLQRYLIFLGLSPEDAQDSVQEAFLRLHRRFESLPDRTNLRGWLFQVAKNLARDKRKSNWAHRTSCQDHQGLTSIEDANDSPETSLLKQERLEWFRSAMARLTEQQVECLKLRASGLRYREIAAVMGIGISSVGELVKRATIRLSEESNEY